MWEQSQKEEKTFGNWDWDWNNESWSLQSELRREFNVIIILWYDLLSWEIRTNNQIPIIRSSQIGLLFRIERNLYMDAIKSHPNQPFISCYNQRDLWSSDMHQDIHQSMCRQTVWSSMLYILILTRRTLQIKESSDTVSNKVRRPIPVFCCGCRVEFFCLVRSVCNGYTYIILRISKCRPRLGSSSFWSIFYRILPDPYHTSHLLSFYLEGFRAHISTSS